MVEDSFGLSGNSVNHNLHSSSTPPSLAPPVSSLTPYSEPQHLHNQRYLPPGAAYASHSPSPSHSQPPATLQRLEPPIHPSSSTTTRTSQNPPTLSLSIGTRPAGVQQHSPLVGSSEWPTGVTPSPSATPSPATGDRYTSCDPPVSPNTADPSFTGIPAGRIQQYSQEPSPRQTQSAHFPSYHLTPHLTVGGEQNQEGPAALRDRGSHSPHSRSQSTGNLLSVSTATMPKYNQQQGEESELLLDRNLSPASNINASRSFSFGLSPPPATLFPSSATGQNGNGRPLSIAEQVVGTPPLETPVGLNNGSDPQQGTRRRGSYYADDDTTPVTSSDMAGVGRNSIIRSVGATSPVLNFRSSIGPGSNASPGGGQNLSIDPTSAHLQQPISANIQIAPSGGGPPIPNPTTGGGGGNGSNTLPPHLIPQPEICVECMMRDRDMADVDVTSRGIWERESDRDWREQLEWEREQAKEQAEEVHSGETGSHSMSTTKREGYGGGGGSGASTQESVSERKRDSTANRSQYSRESNGARLTGTRRRLGKGQALTSGNLKAWTTMNPPAAQHRWRTLQGFLATQIHLLELDRQARARESARLSSHDSHRASSQNRSSRSSTLQMPISTTPEPWEGGRARAKSGGSRGYLVDETNRKSNASSLLPPPIPHQPQPQNQAQAYSPNPYPHQSPASLYPTHPQYIHPSLASSGASIQSYSYGDQPWLASQSARRSSYSKDNSSPATSTKSPAPSMKFNLPKFARSTTDLRSISSPRSLSPARNSVNIEDRDYGGRRSSTSLWSKFRNSTSNQSVMSFNPSASMMDMHLGLSQDKHGMIGGGSGGYRNSGYASSTIGLGPRGYSYQQSQTAGGNNPYDTYPGGGSSSMRGLNMSDPAVARHAELRERDRAMAASKTQATKDSKKKKGFKGFLSKLVGGGDKAGGQGKVQALSCSAPVTPTAEGGPLRVGTQIFDDDILAPPPPLSALANEPRYHQRSSSTSSVDSFTGPYTPPLHASNFRASYAMPLPSSSGSNMAYAADRQSIMTMGSNSSARSKQHPQAQQNSASNSNLDRNGRLYDGPRRPSFDSIHDSLAVPRVTNSPETQYPRGERGPAAGSTEILAQGEEPVQGAYPTYSVAQPRFQKSLPSLPNDQNASLQPQLSSSQAGQFYPQYQTGASRSAYSLVQFPSRPLSPPDSTDDRDRYSSIGSRGGKARKTRSTVFSFFGKKKSPMDESMDLMGTRDPQRARSFDLVGRY